MKFPKFPVYTKIICTAVVSSFVSRKYVGDEHQPENPENQPIPDENPTQQLKVICEKKDRFIVTGNWKMNGNKKIADHMLRMLRCADFGQNQIVIGVPAPYLDYVQKRKPRSVDVGAQNIYKEPKGIFTGENSVDMLVDLDVTWVILGAAERRVLFHEDSELIAEKAKTALNKNLNVILCVGETEEERNCKRHVDAVLRQLDVVFRHVEMEKWRNIVVAYEPLWSVTTERELSADEAGEVHKAIRGWIMNNIDGKYRHFVRIQYGGPLTVSFAKSIVRDGTIDGFYVGSPKSLKQDFIGIARSNLRD